MENKNKNFFEITVKAVVINDREEALLVKRPEANHHGAGKWDFPGGKLEAGENFEEGLEREIKEELGIEVEVETILLVHDFGNKYDKEYAIGKEDLLIGGKGLRFLARYKSGEIKLSHEHDEFEWLPIEKALEKFGDSDFEKDKKISLKKAQKYILMKSALGGWKRAVADFENYKKREAETKKELIAFSNMNLILEILPVVDNFQASTEHVPEDQKNDSWVTGIMHIQRQLENILSENGVKEIDIKEGDKFDPQIMEAISDIKPRNKCESANKNKVKKVLQKGYKINNKVIRAARVIVE